MAEDTKASLLFRKKALDRLTSPDQLNQLMTAVTPTGWVTMGMIGFALICALIWGVVGSIPTTISGSGILLRNGRITQITAQGSGQISELTVKVHDKVKAGQRVGTITQPVLMAQIAGKQIIVDNMRSNYAQVVHDQGASLDEQLRFFTRQRESNAQTIKDYEEQVSSLQRIVDSQQQLLNEGLITESTLLQTRGQLYSAQLSLIQARDQYTKINTDEINARNQAQQAIFAAKNSLVQSEDALSDLQASLDESSKLISPYDGQVADIAAFVGQTVSVGASVVVLEAEEGTLQAVLYFPASDGKKAEVGMRANISPSTAEEEEYGFMVGTVEYVSDVPASKNAMDALLQNDNLVSQLCSSGPPMRINVRLQENSKLFSGFQWSSSTGPKIRITSGTVCSAQIIVQEQPPITLVVPLLRKFFGIKS